MLSEMIALVCVALVCGVVLGAASALFFLRHRGHARMQTVRAEMREEFMRLGQADLLLRERTQANASAKLELLQVQLNERAHRLAHLESRCEELQTQLEQAKAARDAVDRMAAEERLRRQFESETLRETISNLEQQMRSFASQMMNEKSQSFLELNQRSLGEVLAPLREDLFKFEKAVGEVYEKEARERLSLEREVSRLADLNARMSDEARALTQALQGDNKAQGDWGEMTLRRLLEEVGFQEGIHFIEQHSIRDINGAALRPDVVVKLPEERSVVIDSKMSLVAYTRFVSATDDEDRKQAMIEHIRSIRNHVQILANKDYAALVSGPAMDFTLMFMPVEGAFLSAVSSERDLFQFAYQRKVLLVGPSTLLATLRIIHATWMQKQSSERAEEILKKCGDLYDKFEGFVSNMDGIERSLSAAQDSYSEAKKKLVDGKGSIVSRLTKMKSEGLATRKALPSSWIRNLAPPSLQSDEETSLESAEHDLAKEA